ncbi:MULTISPECIES: aspartyl-phosphate phosphatase Spo0E family protein [Kurthia]
MMSDTLLRKLEITREKMIQSGLEKGFLNDETIRLSEKLDQLLNLYQFHTTNDVNDYDKLD